MPHHSSYITAVSGGDAGDAWAIHTEALRRLRAGDKQVIVLSVGDHDLTTDARIVETAVTALRDGQHHYTLAIALCRCVKRLQISLSDHWRAGCGRECRCHFRSAVRHLHSRAHHSQSGRPCCRLRSNVCDLSRRARSSWCNPEPGPTPSRKRLPPRYCRCPRRDPAGNQGNADQFTKQSNRAVWPKKTLEELAVICRENDLWLISDEVYYSMTFYKPGVSARALWQT